MSESPPTVEFLDSHRPPLEAGEYRIFVQQQFSEKPDEDDPAQFETFGGKFYRFDVAGPRYTLSPQEIAAVFPPPGSLGDHSHVFPHVALQRSTLPWERSADAQPPAQSEDWATAPTPWLALLLFDEDDLEKKHIRLAAPPPKQDALTVATLDVADADYPLADPGNGAVTVAAVDVRTKELAAYFPTALECRLLSHVRRNILFSIPWKLGLAPTVDVLGDKFPAGLAPSARATIERAGDLNCWRLTDPSRDRSFLLWENASDNTLQITDAEAAEYAFVIAPRLPKQGVLTQVHLVSLEGRFDHNGRLPPSTKEFTRFVSLYQWRFSCESHEHTFEGLLLHLNRPLASDRPASSPPAFPTLRLPPNQDGATEIRLAAGFTLLPHRFRDGSQSYAWYRGPLAPGPTDMEPLPLPAESADTLLAYDQDSGLFYTGYAAAWELGRLLCLANPRVSQALYQWKREDRRARRQAELERVAPLRNLIVPPPADPAPDLPSVVSDWIRSLRQLDPVPFRHLVPDEAMLPVESIRFFEVDPHWTAALVDGAFSIGRVLEGDHRHDQALHHEQSGELRRLPDPAHRVAGFLLRSAVVSGWPLLAVDALSAVSGQPDFVHPRLRFDRLAPDLLLCLFEGKPSRYEVHLPRETIHFAAEAKDNGKFVLPENGRALWKAAGVALADGQLRLKRKKAPGLDPAVFALHMVERAPRIVFHRPATA